MNGYERIRRDYQEDQETVSRILDAQGRTIPNWRNKTMYQSTGACYSPEERAAHVIANALRSHARSVERLAEVKRQSTPQLSPASVVGSVLMLLPALFGVALYVLWLAGWFR